VPTLLHKATCLSVEMNT